MKVVIFAGGSGTRLWPVSRQHLPKQAQPFADNKTLIQRTYSRLRTGFSVDDIIISTGRAQFQTLAPQLPRVPRRNYILEPVGRDTAAAIGLVAAYLYHRDPKTIMATAWSDAYIKETAEYVRLLKAAKRAVAADPQRTVLLGIKPRYADTGLGYIKMKKQFSRLGRDDVFLVDRFVEKPDQATAEKYVRDWRYLWNPGMFVFRVDALLEKFHQWQPSMYRALMTIVSGIGTRREAATINKVFPHLKKISIDYALMEHDHRMLVIPAGLTWSDVGNWREVYNILSTDPKANIIKGLHVAVDSQGNLLYSYSGKLIAAAGLENTIVIETPDAILVCPMDRAHDVKHIVTTLKKKKLHRYL